MFARLARYEVAPENMEAAVNGFRDAGHGLQELEGLVGGYLLVDSDAGTVMTLTLWDSQTSMETSGARAASLRQRALREANGSVASVEELQVPVEFGGHTRDLRE